MTKPPEGPLPPVVEMPSVRADRRFLAALILLGGTYVVLLVAMVGVIVIGKGLRPDAAEDER